jgi:hypothetical protein
MASYLARMLLAGVVFTAATVAQGLAEQAKSTPTSISGEAKQRSQSVRVPAPAKPTAARRNALSKHARAAQAHQWSIKDALPENSRAIDPRDTEQPSKPTIGRIPWRSGTLGFETETKIKSTETPDGHRLPGVDTNPHAPPSYLGFSLSMPTSDKLLWPFSGKAD